MPIVVDPVRDWLVYDVDHVAEHSLHLTEQEARARAITCASAHHGHQFHVFHYVHGYVAEADAPEPVTQDPAGASA